MNARDLNSKKQLLEVSTPLSPSTSLSNPVSPESSVSDLMELSEKVKLCLKKQKQMHFITKEVSEIIKKSS